METPLVIERYTDNGEHSHWVLINNKGQEIASSLEQNKHFQYELEKVKQKEATTYKHCMEWKESANNSQREYLLTRSLLRDAESELVKLREVKEDLNQEVEKCYAEINSKQERIKRLEESLQDCIHVIELDNEFKDGYPDELNRAIELLTNKQG